ncbi:MAG: N-acetylglucosamine-6-phosphate deacetylase [Bacteroidales bacterium]|nr:N-acetylglucosamine-6-phosphate deacetylase [Bacteroidales bacterium]
MSNYRMKNAIIIYLIQFVFSFSVLAGQQDTLVIEGHFYLDGKPVIIKITNGRFAEIQHKEVETGIPKVFIAPGLIDVQINGYMGVDFAGQDLTLNGIRKATRELWKEGVTTFFPTLISNDHDALKKNFTILAQALDDPEIGTSIPGFHLEGPYISPVKGFRGAHLEKYIRRPDWQEFLEYQNAAKKGIKLITVAPEVAGAIPFIRQCVENVVVVSLGHHNGSAENIKKAIDAGASMSTHLGNGCANMINRHHNPLWPQLADDRLTPSIIADGYHLTKEELQSFYKVKGPGNIILVSDAFDLAGLPPGEYIRGERKVLLTPSVVKFPAENVLAGAASPISKCVSNLIQFTQCSLKDAIQMASTNPAKLLGLDELGEISQGKRASLELLPIFCRKVQGSYGVAPDLVHFG